MFKIISLTVSIMFDMEFVGAEGDFSGKTQSLFYKIT